MTLEEKRLAMDKLQFASTICQKCSLYRNPIGKFFGWGSLDAKIMFVAESHGFRDVNTGEPFAGKSGMLLDKYLHDAGLNRGDIYITDIVKCHPLLDPKFPSRHGNDRAPKMLELRQCIPKLYDQIRIISPNIICVFGNTALHAIFPISKKMEVVHGRRFLVKIPKEKLEFYIMPTFHPEFVLKNRIADVFGQDLANVFKWMNIKSGYKIKKIKCGYLENDKCGYTGQVVMPENCKQCMEQDPFLGDVFHNLKVIK